MSKGVPHILHVISPDLPLELAAAGVGAPLVALVGTCTVVVVFGDGSIYEYPDVPIRTAVALMNDPEGTFGDIRFWPGYRKIQGASKGEK